MWHLTGGQFVFSEKPLRRDPVEIFKALWSVEASAVETYTKIVEQVEDSDVLQTSQFCLQLHDSNEQKLRAYIAGLGDTATDIDIWHKLLSVKNVLATVLPVELNIGLLSKMEEDFLGEYLDALSAFENENLDFIQHQLIPNQEQCFQAWKVYAPAQPDVLPPQNPLSEVARK